MPRDKLKEILNAQVMLAHLEFQNFKKIEKDNQYSTSRMDLLETYCLQMLHIYVALQKRI